MPTANKFYKFSDFVLNPVKRTLFQGNFEIKLGNKDFDVLLFLVENNLRFFSFDDIIKGVWKEVNVNNNSVEKTITNIRKALGDNRKSSRFIKTRRGVGYSFIYDVQEVEENIPVIPSESFNNFSSEKNEFNGHAKNRKTSIFRLLAFCLIIIIFLSLAIFWWKASNFSAEFNTTTIFADNFSDKEINHNRWTVEGKTVRVENGIAKLIVEETDNWGRLKSTYFSIDPNKSITIKSRIKVAYSQNIKDKTYFVGSILLFPKTPIDENDDNADLSRFGITFANYDYDGISSSAPLLEGIRTEGFFLIKNGGRPATKQDYALGKVSARIEPVWNKWFEQKMVYEPFSGKMDYFIDSELRGSFNVGQLPSDLQDNKLRLEITPWGWWLYHSIEIDYITVTQ